MKAALLLTPLLLLAACNKEEEPPATPAPAKPAAQSKTMMPQARRSVAPVPEDAGKAAQPAVPADVKAIEAFAAKAEALVQEWEAFQQLPDDQRTDEALKQVREKYTVLMKERGELMRGMTLEQRREHGRTILGSMAKVGSGLTTWQLSRGRRNLIPPTARRPDTAMPPEAPGSEPGPPATPPAQPEPAPGEETAPPEPASPPQ